MNITHLLKWQISTKAFALLTIVSLLLSAFPAAFFVVEAASDVTIFSDSFENNPAFTSPLWTADPQWGTNSSDAHTGTKQAQATGSNSGDPILQTSIDTSDYEDVTLTFWYQYEGLDGSPADALNVEWFDGTNWNNITSFVGQTTDADDVTVWTQFGPFALPAGADDNASFKIRFVADFDSIGNDKFYLDDVNVSGDDIVTVIPKTVEEIDIFGDTWDAIGNPAGTGWYFNPNPPFTAPFEFNADVSSIGDGAFFGGPVAIDAQSKVIGTLQSFTPVANFDGISYDFNIATNNASDENEFYLNIYANFGASLATKFYDCRYDVVPTTGTVGNFTTVSFDPAGPATLVVKSGSSPFDCPANLADMETVSPGAVIRAFALNIGDTGAQDAGVSGYFDKVVLDTVTKITTYDFEPQPVVYGCLDDSATNYNPDATEQGEVICAYEPIDPPQQCINLLTNGSFEEPVVTNTSLWQKFASVAGWVIEKVTDSTPTTLELHRNWSSNEAADGLQYAELDGDHSTKVSQPVATLPGGEYKLSWEFAPRHNIDAEQNVLSVLLNGISVATSGPATGAADLAVADWTYGSHTFIASATSTVITFADAGPSNSYGTYLDDAQLCLVKAPEPEPEICEDASLVGAATVDEVNQETRRDGSPIVDVNRIDPTETLSTNDWVPGTGTNFFSLGFGGSITLEFDRYVLDVAGTDFKVYEGTNGSSYPEEIAKIEVSQNGVDFEVAGTASSNNPNRITDVDFASTSFAWIKFVRLTDMTNLAIHSNDADGFDLDAVVAAEVVCVPPYEPEEPKELPQCSQYFTDGIVISQEQVLLSHDEGGAFIGPQTVNIPAGYYDVNALSFDYHTDNLWDNLPFEQWFVNGLLNEGVVFTSTVTDDLPTGQNTIITQLDRATYFPNGLDALEWVHAAYPNGEYHSIHPLCLQFVPVEPEIAQCTIESSTDTVIVENNDYAVPTYEHNNWTASIPGATWIWETYYSADSGNLDNDITRNFRESFTLGALPATALIDIAADNGFVLYVNEQLVLDRSLPAYDNNFQTHSFKEDVDVSSYLIVGNNTMRIEVTNKGVDGSNSMGNPAGVLYKLTMEVEEGTQCEKTTEPEVVVDPEEYSDIIFGTKYRVNGDSDPTPVPNWTIYAYNWETEELLSTTTDADGNYSFVVGEGDWEVYEELPSGTTQTSVYRNGEMVYGEGEGPYSCYFWLYDYEELEVQAFISEAPLFKGNGCDFYNEFTEVTEVTEGPGDSTEQPSNNRSGRSSGTLVKPAATPLVAGASTSLCPFLNDYMQIGIENDSFEVSKLQLFLKIVMGYVSPITGIFDATTDANVKAFQLAHKDEILTPWYEKGIVPHDQPTGFVYKLTRWKINDIVCPGYEAYPSFDGENLQTNINLD